uniref:ATP synthase F0 subunit 6 n=1 Tax=Cyphocaris challengeri TaxID=3018532 RepID=UPI0022FD492D|nr:ATP synthase F0 subunit 6 [Cyphocaris challengeri]WBQ48836.1 ATP synthase F0 subunit 6 [Cyphocaris challengeri]
MMTNLFSIFDPATPNLISNWSSMFMFLLFMPTILWSNNNRWLSLNNHLIKYIMTEFKPLINKSTFSLSLSMILFMLIMYNNVLGMVPYIFTASSHMVFTLSLALPLWLALMLYGWLNNYSSLLIHLIPQGTPVILMPFMVIIELISALIRPLTLAIRLAANMIAGHLLMVLLSSSFLTLPAISFIILTPSLVLLSLLEIAVAFIQAYVFSVLITLYLAESIS